MKIIVTGFIALLVVVAGILTFMPASHKKSVSDAHNTNTTAAAASKAGPSGQPTANPASTQPQPSSSTPSSSQPSATASPKAATATSPLNVTVAANDDSASPETINATAGETVNITFAVQEQGTYHGGLEFKSSDPAIDSGPIAMGSSKVVTFTATKPFKFTPFWYASNVQKPYFVTVNVQ